MKVELTKAQMFAAMYALGNFTQYADWREQVQFFGSAQMTLAAHRAHIKLFQKYHNTKQEPRLISK